MSDSTRLQLRVAPGASKPGIVGRYGASWKVRVAAAPEGGKANAAVIRLLADTLVVPVRAIEVVSGHSSRDKIVELAGLAPDETERRLTAASTPGRDSE